MAERLTAQPNRPLRLLLPGVLRAAVPGETTTTQSRRLAKRPNTATACDSCRKYKAKCSGCRPTCHRCTQRRIPCHYTVRRADTRAQALQRSDQALRDRAGEHEDVVALLRRLPEDEALAVLQRMRAGEPLSTILGSSSSSSGGGSQVRTGNVLLQMAVTPETRLRYVFPYRAAMPAALLRPSRYGSDSEGMKNPYLDSLIYEVASVLPLVQGGTTETTQTNGHDGGRRRRALVQGSGRRCDAGGGCDAMYLSPFHAARLYEPRLTDAKVAPWTNVCADDAMMREMLEVFFRCEYQFTAAFQKDLFLEDLASGRTEFCSSLLVNVILAYASVCNSKLPNRSEYWNPKTLAYRFLAEARRLWELVANEPRITTVQAGILFSVFYNLCGLDEVGQAYRIHSATQAYKLGLMDAPVDGESSRTQRGKAYTAWTLYNWETLVAFSFMHAPLVKHVPKCPLPDPVKDPEWYGEIWIKYPADPKPVPVNFGQTFRQKTRFRIIMNVFSEEAYSTATGITIHKAEKLRFQLENWLKNLPPPLEARNIVLPAQLQLHMYYHHLLLSIYEPLLDMATPHEPTPRQIVDASKKYVHTLMRIYYLRHGYEAMDLFIVVPFMVVADECLDSLATRALQQQQQQQQQPEELEEEQEDLRSTVILIAKGLHDQRRNHYLAEALFRVLRGRMGRQEVMLLRRALGGGSAAEADRDDESLELAQAVRSHWPVSVVRRKEDLDSKVLGNLVECYAHLNVQDDGSEGGASSI